MQRHIGKRQKICITERWKTPGIQTARRESSILQTGMENRWYTTECTGHLQRRLIHLAVLYRVTENEKYAADYAEFMKYLDEKVLDHVHGSWFHQLDRENHLLETVWPGKSDIYHALQATLIPYYAPGLSIAVAVKKSL